MMDRRSKVYGCYDARYFRELVPTYIVLIAAFVLIFAVPRTPTTRLAGLGLVSLAVAWSIVVTVAAIRRLDELQQRIHLIAIAVSFTATGIVAAMTRFLNAAGWTSVPTGMGLWLFMCLAWVTAVVVLNRRYR